MRALQLHTTLLAKPWGFFAAIMSFSSQKHVPFLGFLILCLFHGKSVADDTDIYLSGSSSGASGYVMLAIDYRQDLSGPYCRSNGSAANRCIQMLDTPATFTFLQSLDVLVNGVPAGAADGDADGDGLRDSSADMQNFEASKLQALIAVTRAVFENYNGIHVGLMISNNDNGGTILRGYREFVVNDTNNAKQELIDILLSLPLPSQGNQYHESQPKEMHYEWYRYINNGGIIYGDQTANNFNGTNTPAPDSSIFSGGNYFSSNDYSCSKFYEVYVTSGNETGTDAALTTEISNDMSPTASSNFEEMMRYMSNNDLLTGVDGTQNLKAWIVQVGSSAAHADDWAEAAGTDDEYMVISNNANELVDIYTTLSTAFNDVAKSSETFVSSSIPVNVFDRSKSLDNFYTALFEPSSTTRWAGNIKKYKLLDSDSDFRYDQIVDTAGRQVYSEDDGKIINSTLSFWTNNASLPPADPELGQQTGRDGSFVTLGGAGQKLPGFIGDDVGLTNSDGQRQVFVEPASGTTLAPFDATTAVATTLQTLIGSANAADAQTTISWARGVDVDDEDGDLDFTDARPWIMGAPLHSRPLAINYGTTGGYSQSNPNIRVFFGTNSGFFHMLENTRTSGGESGEELFSFIPRELLSNLPALRANSTGTQTYGMDGEPVALVDDKNFDGNIAGTDEVYVYTGMRRGGKSYYAFDVSNPSSTPSLQWKITKTSSGDFDELGFTFSTPRVAKVRYEDAARDVLIFAGGFDLQKDDSAGSIARGPDSEGNAIYIVDARTGALIWKVTGESGIDSNTVLHESELTHSIPSSVAVLDSNRNGIVDRLYVGDTGSVVWRVDLPEGTSADPNHRRNNWSITKLGNFWNSSGSQDRRFFHAPEIVSTKDALGAYDGIVIVSGDRANPTETRDTNYLFMIKDRHVVSGNPPPASMPASEGVYDEDDLADVTPCDTTACSVLDLSNGWKIELEGRGEKGLAQPLIVNGKIFYTTYSPASSANACGAPEGQGQLNIVDLRDGGASFNGVRSLALGPGIPSAVVPVSANSVLIPSTGVIDPFDPPTDLSKEKIIEVGGKVVYKLFWRAPGRDQL